MNNDIRNLSKWLNEEQEAPIDRQALARVLAMAEQPAPVQQEPAWRTAGGIPRFKPAQQEPVAAQSVMTVRIWRDKNSDQNAEFKNWHKLPDGEHILYTSPSAQHLPDAIHHTDTSEHPEYIAGWNDCRKAMMK